jgi:hypothetical protein
MSSVIHVRAWPRSIGINASLPQNRKWPLFGNCFGTASARGRSRSVGISGRCQYRECSEESYQQQIYEADPTYSPTINQSSPHRRPRQEPDGRRGRLPRHARWTNRSHVRRYVTEEMHHTYRKILNLRPMRDGGFMSASKFASRIHHLIWRVAMSRRWVIPVSTVPSRGTIWSQSSEPSLEIVVANSCFNW